MPIRVVNVRGLRTAEERAAVVYVGRPFAGWPGHALANPFRVHRPRSVDPLGPQWAGAEWDEDDEARARAACLDKYRVMLAALGEPILAAGLAALWAETGGGRKPLGCWCASSVVGDGQPVVCHAQILAAMLTERFAPAEV